MLITQQLSTVAAQNGGKAAVSFLEKDINYHEFKTRVARLGYLFQKEIGHQARVAFLCSNSPAALECFFALSSNRSVTIPLDPAVTDDELAAWFKSAQATHLAVTSDLLSRARTLLMNQRLGATLIEVERKQGGEYDASYSPPPDKVPVETDPILLLRTPGTADKPKLVEFTHKQVYNAVVALKRPYHTTAADRFLTKLNWSSPFGLLHGMLFPLLTGGTCIIDHGLEGQDFLSFIVKARATRLVGTPNFFRKLLVLCVERKTGLPGVKSCTAGMDKLSKELREAYQKLKMPLCQTYGMTEALWTLAMEDSNPAEGGASNALPGFKYKVIDENGDEIAGDAERTGQLAVTSPSIMTRYMLKDKEASEKATKNAIRGTWLYTGDLATLEGQGDRLKIIFRARKDETLFNAGQYILPEKVDKILKGCPGILDAAGFVTKNAMGQRVLMCALVKQPGAAVKESQILEWCKANGTGEYKAAAYLFVDTIPRTTGGGVHRLSLARQFSGTPTA